MFQALVDYSLFNKVARSFAHNPGNSAYPFLVAVLTLSLVLRGVRWLEEGGHPLFLLNLVILLFCAGGWGKDVYIEGARGQHTLLVQSGLTLSFLLFVFREAILFVSIFWVYLDLALVPRIWGGKVWPYTGILPPNYFGVPLLGTCLLLRSGLRVTWCHASVLRNFRGNLGIFWTLIFATGFLFTQLFEYYWLSFRIRDSAFASIFFLGTGFHGLHVLAGLCYLLYTWAWIILGSCNPLHHVGFKCAVLYWHFVDVVWLFLYVVFYVWGS